MKAESILAALVALVTAASADQAGCLPSAPFPALAAAPLVYVLAPDPFGAGTWAEREIEAIRLGTGSPPRGEGAAVDVLRSLHAATPAERALEMSEAPRDEPVRTADAVLERAMETPEEVRVLGALEAMGLEPEDLVEAPEMPAAALALADFLTRIDAFLSARRPRERGSDIASFRVDPEARHVKQPAYVRHKKPPEDPEPKTPPLTLYAKKVTRSLYKALLGVAIGILIWGFVRNSG